MRKVDDVGDIIDRQWEDRANSLDQVRKKLRSGWRNDDAVLNQYFQSCVANWKIYKGQRTPQQVLKLQAVYKQAVYGDNVDLPPVSLDSTAGLKWQAWNRLKGISKEMAKRRFITFLSEIDPLLIDVMPDEKPPPGFPLDRKGQPICAKCNTVVGCARPLLDQNKMNLKQQLFENADLHEPEKFRNWVKNALANQRCVWGVHQAIANADKKPFLEWFNRDENRGFFAYDSSSLMFIIRELVTYHHEIAYDMMQHKDSVEAAVYNAQSAKTTKLKDVYTQLSGEDFAFEIACDRDNDACNQRRKADNGHNHKHPVEIDPPTFSDVNTMEEAIELRMQCQKLGISPSTGVVKDIQQRCDIYRKRIADHLVALEKAAQAKDRNENRVAAHKGEKLRVKELSRDMFQRQCWEACHMNLIEHILTLVRRGCDPNEESPKGLTPLLTLIINDATVEQIEELISLKANVNMSNRFGLTPLMMACRLGDVKMLHILMRNNASAQQKGSNGGRTALHWCVVHGCEDLVRTIVEYLKDGVGDALRVTRLLDAQTDEGETALILAARVRNGSMCHLLSSLGCNPNMRNNKGRNASYLARTEGWSEIADWLEKKVGSGVARLETFSDLQFEKQLRYGVIKMREIINDFGKTYLTLLQNRISLHPLGCPFVAKARRGSLGEKEEVAQRTFVDNHQYFIMGRDPTDYEFSAGSSTKKGPPPIRALNDLDEQSMKELRDRLVEMLNLIRQGTTNPNVEAPAKPLSWTALMCAAALNDVRTVKLMMREGASPNYPNRNGTTALMLAAQLNNTDVLVELLVNGGDLNAVDNEGYSALAYAGSLPLPSGMQRDAVSVLMDGDTDGPKAISSVEIIKMAMSCGVGELKQAVKTNLEAAQPHEVENHLKFTTLLERYGLTSVQTERQLHDQVKTTGWRVKEGEFELQSGRGDWDDNYSEESSAANPFEEEAMQRYQSQLHTKATQDRLREQDVRCPICTLNVPCAHFYKLAALLKFIDKKNAEAAAKEAAAEKRQTGTHFQSSKKLKMRNRGQEILEEAHIDDRNTDRSLALAKKYREKEIEVDKTTAHRLLVEEQRKEADVLLLLQQESNSPPLLLENGSASPFPQRRDLVNADSTASSDVNVNKATMRNTVSEAVLADLSVGGEEEHDELSELLEQQATVSVPTITNGIVSILKPTKHGETSLVVVGCAGDGAEENVAVPKMSHTRRVTFNLPAGDGDTGTDTDDISRPSSCEQTTQLSGERESSPPHSDIVSAEENLSSSQEDSTAKNELMANLQFLPVDGSFKAVVGDNPIPLVQRKLFLFMKDSLSRQGQTDGLLVAPSKPTQLRSQSQSDVAPVKVQISGWIFISTSDLHSKVTAALESITLPLGTWGGILDRIQTDLRESWMPMLLAEPLLDVRTWKPTAPRCAVCSIGFVRFKGSLEQFRTQPLQYEQRVEANRAHHIFEESDLCFPCVVRRSLFEKVSAALPRSLRSSVQLHWPFFSDQRPRIASAEERYNVSGVSRSQDVADDVSVLSDSYAMRGDNQMTVFSPETLPQSPVRSHKLSQIDQLESCNIGDSDVYGAIEAIYSSPPRWPAHDDVSVGSGVSLLTNSLEECTETTPSTISTLSVVDPVKRPKEMALIPFLVAKGHFEEAERTVRIAIGKTAVDEGEGMLVLLKLLHMQAEMYKVMGLWPLALGIYLDCVDLTVTLLGISDFSSMAALGLLCSCLRQMQEMDAASAYVRALCILVESNSLKSAKKDIVKNVREQDRLNIKTFLRNSAIWTQHIKPTLPTNYLKLRLVSVLGIGGLYSLFTACGGFAATTRTVFVAHCLQRDRSLGLFAQFVDYCFRLRSTSDPEVYRHLVQHIIQKQLAKKLVSSSEVARLYRELTSKHYVDAVNQFLRFGVPLSVEAFDQLLIHALWLLTPVYRRFLLFDEAGNYMREHQVEVIAEALDISATVIQCVWRRKLMHSRFKVLWAMHLKVLADNKLKMLNHQKFRNSQKR